MIWNFRFSTLHKIKAATLKQVNPQKMKCFLFDNQIITSPTFAIFYFSNFSPWSLGNYN